MELLNLNCIIFNLLIRLDQT